MKCVFIIVCYNDSDNLTMSLRNMSNYLSKNLHLLVIDGNSTDGTLNVLSSFKMINPEYFNYISEPDCGLYDAMNKGWNICEVDDFICFIGAGDYLLNFPSKIPFNYDAYYGKVKLGSKYFRMNFSMFRNNFMGNYIHHQGVLIRKRNYNSPFSLRFPVYADYNFNLKLINSGIKFQYLENFETYADPNGISSKFNLKEMFKVILSHSGLSGAFIFLLLFGLRKLFKKNTNEAF